MVDWMDPSTLALWEISAMLLPRRLLATLAASSPWFLVHQSLSCATLLVERWSGGGTMLSSRMGLLVVQSTTSHSPTLMSCEVDMASTGAPR